MTGKIEKHNEENPDEDTHVPNDYPIPSEYPDNDPAPVKEPKQGPLPGMPKDAPIQEPNKNPRIRVLNLQA